MSLYLALLTVGLLAMAGLVVDGGTAMAARAQAADLAQEAARHGADALAPDSLRGTSPTELRVDPVAARQAAQEVLASAGATGEVAVSGRDVTVTAHVRAQAVILSAVGLTDLSGTAHATATVLHGTTTGGP